MVRKKIKITLVYKGDDGSYIVTQVLNSVRWVPGQNLTKQAVKELAESPIEVAVVGK
jgi:hypothetical protein